MVATCRQFYRRLFVVVWCLCCGLGLSSSLRRRRRVVEVNYDVQEEQPIGSFIGDVKHDANLTSLYETSVVEQLRFTFMRQYSTQLFGVDATTGVVRSTARVDREQLCPGGVELCVIRIDVAVRPVDYFMIVRITVRVVDTNDHVPVFRDRHLTVEVLESADPGTAIVLPLAVDPDSPPLSVVEYRLDKSTDADVFRLVHHHRSAGGFGALKLELVAGLDRELVDVYQMMLIAIDGGSPPQTGSIELTVKVIDVNDNSPRFEHADYDITVPEDVTPGTTLLHIAALDADDGLNGRVIYELSRQGLMDSSSSLPFAVNNRTGAVVVLASLDRDRGPSMYEFSVTARDMGPDAVATTCVVVVRLTDVNDNAPDIMVDGLLSAESSTTSTLSAETARVTENAREGTFVAHVTVIDPDQGAAGRFNCSLANDDNDDVNATEYFRLNQFDDSEFQLVTAAEAHFDREREADFRFAVVCSDYGRPSRTSYQQVRVVIADINDCAPTFSRDVYHAEIIENNYVGATLFVATAYDADSGDNARLTYSLIGSQADYFRVDHVTGEITAVTSFDREKLSTISFTVVARDAGIPPLSGSATVIVSIIDVNDNSPEFDVIDGREYVFRVDENQSAGTFVGQVSALDPDSGDNGNVSYSIVSDASLAWLLPDLSTESVHGVFELEPYTGVLSTRRTLDAELTETYRFQVSAVDGGKPARSSSVSVVVVVGDVNEHRPQFVFPSSASSNIVYIPPTSIPQGYVIVAVSATDPDVGPATSIVYGLADESRCFEIDGASGIVRVTDTSQLIGRADGWTFSLTVTATDQGGLQTSEMLYVVVNSSASADLMISGSDGWEAFAVDIHHVVIVACIVAVCGVLIVGLVVFIASVRGRQRRLAAKRRSRRYNCRAAASKRLQQDGAAAAVQGHLPPVNAWNSNDASQSLLVRPNNDSDSGQDRSSQPLVKCYSNDGSVEGSQLNEARTILKRSPNCNRKVGGATTMRPQQQTLSTFNFRSLPRIAADIQHSHHHHCHPSHHCQPAQQQSSQCQNIYLPVTSAHGLHQQPYTDVSSSSVSAQENVRFLTQKLRGPSSNAAVLDISEDATMTLTSKDNAVPNSSTKPSNCADTGANSRRFCIRGNGSPPQNDINAMNFYCRPNYDTDETETETVICFPMFADSQRPSSVDAVNSDTGVECGRTDADEDDDEAWTTTSGSYNAGDLCDEIDQLFFAQSPRDRNLVSLPNNALY